MSRLDQYISSTDRVDESIDRLIMQITREIQGSRRGGGLTITDAIHEFTRFITMAGLEGEVLRIINNSLGTRFRSLDDLVNLRIFESTIDESKIVDWLSKSIKPMKTVLSKISKLISSVDDTISPKTIAYAIYGIVMYINKTKVGNQ